MSRLVYISTNYRYNKENPTNFGGDEMEYKTERRLEDIAPLLERLDRGETLFDEEQAELAAIRILDGSGWEGELPRSISGMMDLERLHRIGTQAADLSLLSGLTALKSLFLEDSNIRDLTPLSGLEQLKTLYLRNCNLRAIPRTLYKHLDLKIILVNTTLSTQPISIFRESDEVIRAYYDAPKVSVRESKVIFLGDGGAGKTHTIKRILNKGNDDSIGTDATLGISINSYPAEGKTAASTSTSGTSAGRRICTPCTAAS